MQGGVIMKEFINRKVELDALEAEYKRAEASFVVIYGRRRTGKTALIREFIKVKKSIYFLATEENETQNKNLFRQVVARGLNNQLLKEAEGASWESIFDAVASTNLSERIILVIDEFQYLERSSKGFSSLLNRIWEGKLQGRNVMLIICGSYVSMMKDLTLNYNSPLYGRRTAQINLHPLSFESYMGFFPGQNLDRVLNYYALTGGIPKYAEIFSETKDLYKAIEKNIVFRSSYLYEEPKFLLQNETRDVGTYFSILRSIAAGNKKLSDIASQLEIKQTNLSKPLEILIELDIVERDVPVTEKNPERSKKGLYFIKDNYIRFWFRYIYPFESYIESGQTAFVMEQIKKTYRQEHMGIVYEGVCKDLMYHLSSKGLWDFDFAKVGRWWINSGEEIDIAAISLDNKKIVFGECKYSTSKKGTSILMRLENKVKNTKAAEDVEAFYVIFSQGGFTEELKEFADKNKHVKLLTLESALGIILN